MTCLQCHRAIPANYAHCEFCMVEVGTCELDGEPVKQRPLIENTITKVEHFAPALRQAIARGVELDYRRMK